MCWIAAPACRFWMLPSRTARFASWCTKPMDYLVDAQMSRDYLYLLDETTVQIVDMRNLELVFTIQKLALSVGIEGRRRYGLCRRPLRAENLQN